MFSGKASPAEGLAPDRIAQLTQPPCAPPGRGGGAACRVAADAEAAAWNDFAAAQPLSNLGHAFEWKRVIEKAYGKQTYFLRTEEDGVWTGVLPLVHMAGPLTGNRLVSLPFLDQAGILAASEEAAGALWRAAGELARNVSASGIDIRAREAEGASGGERSTLVLALPSGADALWKSFSPKVRNQVRKAEKEGLRTEPAEAPALREFYEVFARNMRDLGSPVHAQGFLAAVLEAFGSRAKLYLTRDGQGRAIGGAVALTHRGTVTVPWASSLREAFSSCPNHSLYWRILSDAAREGFQAFDFGRSHADSGTFRFKQQWGAEARPLRWASFDAQGNAIAQKVYKPSEHGAATWIWSRLPLWAANRLGPLIRSQLSN